MPSGISIMEFSMELLCSNVSFHSQDPKLDAFSSEWIYHSLEKKKNCKTKRESSFVISKWWVSNKHQAVKKLIPGTGVQVEAKIKWSFKIQTIGMCFRHLVNLLLGFKYSYKRAQNISICILTSFGKWFLQWRFYLIGTPL